MVTVKRQQVLGLVSLGGGAIRGTPVTRSQSLPGQLKVTVVNRYRIWGLARDFRKVSGGSWLVHLYR